ncbi:MAG: 30S ribosomal protein S6e [Candidatus Woesearchaeota archaeon]
MVDMKLVINDVKTGKSYKKELDLDLGGVKIGDKVAGEQVGLKGYELQFTGGSDDAGFPMRKDIDGPNRKKALMGSGPGVRIKRKGMKLRKTVRGNAIGAKIVQANLKVVKYGAESLEKALGVEKKEELEGQPSLKKNVGEEKAKEKKVEEKPVEKKVEEKPKEAEAKTEEKKVEEKKEA